MGPVLIRLDFLLVIAGAAVIASPLFAICLALAIACHELGHALAARWIARERFRLLLQLAGGRAYIRGVEAKNRRAMVLAAGPIASFALVVVVLGSSRMASSGLTSCSTRRWYGPVTSSRLIRRRMEDSSSV